MIIKRVCFLAFVLLPVIMILTSGCETTKNVAKGIAQGVPADAKNTWQSILKADKWIDENLW